MSEYYEMPQPEDIPIKEKENAMGAYLMMFASLGAGLPLPMINVIASIIYYFIYRHNSPFVKFHLVQSLWSQVPLSLLNGFIVIWTIKNFVSNAGFSSIYIGLVLSVVIFNIIYIIFSIYAAMLARRGRVYYFIFFGRLAYEVAFKVRTDDVEMGPKSDINVPPM